MSELKWQLFLVPALVSGLMTLVVEWLAKPALEARKRRIVDAQQIRREALASTRAAWQYFVNRRHLALLIGNSENGNGVLLEESKKLFFHHGPALGATRDYAAMRLVELLASHLARVAVGQKSTAPAAFEELLWGHAQRVLGHSPRSLLGVLARRRFWPWWRKQARAIDLIHP